MIFYYKASLCVNSHWIKQIFRLTLPFLRPSGILVLSHQFTSFNLRCLQMEVSSKLRKSTKGRHFLTDALWEETVVTKQPRSQGLLGEKFPALFARGNIFHNFLTSFFWFSNLFRQSNPHNLACPTFCLKKKKEIPGVFQFRP